LTLPWVEDVLAFWFGLRPDQWFSADPDLDAEITARFRDHWDELRSRPVDSFLGSSHEALAAVILFDQFPRNMLRGHADQFATDSLASQIAKAAIARGRDRTLSVPERTFLYMPFQHSEELGAQQQSLQLFVDLGDARVLQFARRHFEVIERFGRSPHRNAVLGRRPTAEEEAAGDVDPTKI